MCPTELCAYNDKAKEFEGVDAKVVACSVDSEYAHMTWSKIPRKEGG